MAIIHVNTKEELQKEVQTGTSLIDFYADWCGPCKMLAPFIEELAKERTDVKFIKVDVDHAQEIAKEFEIMSIPTLITFKDGKQVQKHIGFAPKTKLEELIA